MQIFCRLVRNKHLLLLLCLGGCVSEANYWTYLDAHYEVTSTQRVINPEQMCALRIKVDGCIVKHPHTMTADIYIKSGLPTWLDQCTETHERKHAAGGMHKDGIPSDCYL